jgi:hypothetical protein
MNRRADKLENRHGGKDVRVYFSDFRGTMATLLDCTVKQMNCAGLFMTHS